jgi:hypothetical protein
MRARADFRDPKVNSHVRDTLDIGSVPMCAARAFSPRRVLRRQAVRRDMRFTLPDESLWRDRHKAT